MEQHAVYDDGTPPERQRADKAKVHVPRHCDAVLQPHFDHIGFHLLAVGIAVNLLVNDIEGPPDNITGEKLKYGGEH